MTSNDAGDIAGSAPKSMPTKPPISPAALKLAECLARRMVPMIESAAKRKHPSSDAATDQVGQATTDTAAIRSE
jgi:hypothetical protein